MSKYDKIISGEEKRDIEKEILKFRLETSEAREKHYKKMYLLYTLLGVTIGLLIGFAAALYISPDKAEDKLTQSSSTVMNVPSNDSVESTTSSTEAASSAHQSSNTLDITAPDTAHNVLLKTDTNGLTYLSMAGYAEGSQAEKSYIYENNEDLNRKKDNSPDGVYYYIWINKSNLDELMKSAYFEEVEK